MDRDLTERFSSTKDRIAQIVTNVRPEAAAAGPVRECQALTDAGVSSLDMVNIMLAIEASFDIFIPADMIGPANFRSVETMATMVDRILAKTTRAVA